MKSSSSSVSANILSFDGLKHLRQLQYSKLNKKVAALQYVFRSVEQPKTIRNIQT